VLFFTGTAVGVLHLVREPPELLRFFRDLVVRSSIGPKREISEYRADDVRNELYERLIFAVNVDDEFPKGVKKLKEFHDAPTKILV
jgi:hypothetical protein